MSKRITLDNLKTFLTQLKTHITDPIINDVSTLSVKVRNAENNIITANSNISSVQQALNNKADNTHNHDSVYVKQDGSTPITSPLQLNQGSYVLQNTKVDGIYNLVAEIIILAPYQNRPIKFEIASKGHKTNCTFYIQFQKNNWTNDPDIECFGYTGFSTDYSLYLYMVKKDTSTWDLYIKKTEENDTIDITDFSNTNTNTSIIWKNEGVSTLPEGCICATPLQYPITDVTNLQTTLFVRNDGIINKNVNNCFNSENGEFRANESGQYLVMCSGYELQNSSTYVACVVSGTSGNLNKLYTSGSSGFTIITLEKDQTLSLYTCVAGNINQECISSMTYVDMLIAKIN